MDEEWRESGVRRLLAGGTEPAVAAVGGIEIVDTFKPGGLHFLYQELRNAIAFLDGDVLVGMVEQKDLDFSPVLGVDYACTAVDSLLHRKTAARPDEADMACRNGNTQSGGDQFASARGQDIVLRRFQVRSGIAGMRVGRKLRAIYLTWNR